MTGLAMNDVADATSRDPVLEALLVHRHPMMMLSRALAVDVPGEASAVADVSRESIFYDPLLGGVPPEAAIEFMAQTMALAVGADSARRGEKPRPGYLLGTRRLSPSIAFFDPDREYVVTAKCVYSDDEFASFDCAIALDGEEVARATLMACRENADK